MRDGGRPKKGTRGSGLGESRHDERTELRPKQRTAASGGRLPWPRAALMLIGMALLSWLIGIVLRPIVGRDDYKR